MDGTLRFEWVVLMGLVTLLGATGTFFSALAGLAISALAALAVCLVHLLLKVLAIESPGARWSLIISTGFLVSWILSGLATFLVVIPPGAILYLQLAGVSPIVFYGLVKDVSAREALLGWAQFGILLILVGSVREFFGRGTFAGYLTPVGFTIPADFFASPVGAFLIVGLVVLGSRLVVGFLPTNNGGEQ